MSVVPFATSPGSEEAGPAQTDAADARQRMLTVKRTLEEASAAVESLQSTLAAQHELEQLLKQGRTHLQDLRARLQRAEEERDRFHAELAEARRTHQRDVDQLQQQLDEQAAAHRQFAEERENERSTFTRLLNEGESKEREMMQERDQQRQQLDALREAGMRAQSLAREIVRTHESAAAVPPAPPEE
jgi:fumarate hydratase class II